MPPAHLIQSIIKSPPSTPSAPPKFSQSDYPFELMLDPAEDIEEYRPRHLHPVHTGDLFCDSRYEIMRKLGYGLFSTVWLAKGLK